MWEGLMRAPRGRVSARNLFMLLTTWLVTIFANTLFMFTPVFAAGEATWLDACSVAANADKSCVSYEGREYVGATTKVANDGYLGVPTGAIMFFTTHSGSNTASVLYFDPSHASDFGSANAAWLITYSYTDNNGTTPGGYVLANPSQPTATTVIPRTPPGGNLSNPVQDGTTSCAVEGVGWIICPVTNFLAAGMDKVYTVVSEYLKVAPLATTTDSSLYRAWSYAQAISNLLFIIAFLVIIYSQLTGTGIDAYTMRKILPRIVIAAVLINVSYWIAAIAVDMSNILGQSINSVFMSIRNSLVGAEGNTWEYLSWGNMAAVILSGGSLAAGAGIGAYLSVTAITAALASPAGVAGVLMLFVPMLLSVLFVILMTFLILAARQALIIVLVIIAPLAFAAYLLPNTDKWFKAWQKTLFTLLLLYPGFSVVFGGAQLASSVILQGAKGANSFTMLLLAMCVQVAPLAIMPLLLRLGGGVLNRFAGIVNNPSKGVFDKGKQWARDRSAENKAAGIASLYARANTNNLPTRRFDPRRMTYARMQSQLRREGLKSANEATTKGYFSQTADARQIYLRNKRAGLEQEIGDNESDAVWQTTTYTNAGLNARVHRAHEAHERAALYKSAVEEQGKEHWAHTVQHDPTLRAVRTDKHHTGNRAKIIEESMTNADERSFQQALNTDAANAALRGLKVRSDLDKQVADFHVRRIAADGKRNFQQQIYNDRALKNMLNQTVQAEKTAASMEKILKDNAEARFERISTDMSADGYTPSLRELRLHEVESESALSLATERWKTTIENIRAKGAEAPDVRKKTEKVIAANIKASTRDITVQQKAQEAAKVVASEQLMADFEESFNDPTSTLLDDAAGIGGDRAKTRIYAKATEEVVNAAVGEVKTNKAITSKMTRKQLHRLMKKAEMPDGTKATVEMQQAAMYALLEDKGNNEDAQEIRDAIAQMGMMMDEDGNYYEALRDKDGFLIVDEYGFAQPDKSQPITNKKEIARRRDWQQFFDDAASKSPHNMGTYSGTNRSEARAGTMVDATREAFVRDMTGGKFSPDKILKADIDELKLLLEDLHSPTGYYSRIPTEKQNQVKSSLESAILRLQNNENVNSGIEDRARGAMNDILAFVNPKEYAYDNRDYAVNENKAIVPKSKLAETPTKEFHAPVDVPGVHYKNKDGSGYYTKWEVDTQLDT